METRQDAERTQEDILSSFREERMEQRKKKPAILIGISIGTLIAVTIGCLTFGRYVSVYYGADSGELPVIGADGGADGMKPASPGGMEVPNRDKLVYERLRQNNAELPVERLLPAAEKPVAPAFEQQADDIGSLVADMAAKEEDAPASAVVYEEDGTPVEVMFRPADETAPAAEPEVAPAPVEQKPAERKPSEPAAKPDSKATERKTAPETREQAKKPVVSVVDVTGAFSVQLVSARTESAAESEWKRLSKKHREILANQPHVISKTVVANGTFYRLRVGKFKKREEAKALCEQLKNKKQECFVVK